MGLERGGKSDTRQRRALQKLAQDPFGILGLTAGDGVLFTDSTGAISILLDPATHNLASASPTGLLIRSPLFAKGDIWTWDAADAPLAVGVDGRVLTADSGAATGLAWATPTVDWANVTGTPTTLSGYGITDGALLTDPRFGVQIGPTTSDQTAIGSSFTAVTGLTATLVASSTYAFDFWVVADADSTLTGVDIAVNGPSTPAYLYGTQQYWTALGTLTSANFTAYNADTASAGSAGTAKAIYRVFGTIKTGVAGGSFGPVIKRLVTGTSLNVRAGSYGSVRLLS